MSFNFFVALVSIIRTKPFFYYIEFSFFFHQSDVLKFKFVIKHFERFGLILISNIEYEQSSHKLIRYKLHSIQYRSNGLLFMSI